MNTITFREMIALIREDRSVHIGGWLTGGWMAPGFQALATHRFGRWVYGLPLLPRVLLLPLVRMMLLFVRSAHGIELGLRTSVGRRVWLVHQSGIVIHPNAVIGDDCVIRHSVTIGAAGLDKEEAPTLGRRVELGPGVVIMGGVHIGDGARIGPNATVMTNIPANALVVTPPPRILFAPKKKPRTVPTPDPIAETPDSVSSQV